MKINDLVYRYRNLRKKKSILFFWIISYTIILLIPVLFSGVVYYISSNEINDEINKSGIAMLKQMQMSIDNTLSEAQRLSINLTNNKKVLKVAGFRKPLQDSDRYAIAELVTDLKSNTTTSKCIESYYLYFKGIDKIVSPLTSGDSSLMYEVLGHGNLISYDDWHKMLLELHTIQCVPLTSEDDEGHNKKMVAYLQTIPINAPSQPQGTVVVLIDESELMKMARNIHGANTGDVLILNKNNEVLASTKSYDMRSVPRFEDFNGESGILKMNLSGEKVSIFYNTSEISKLKFIEIVPESVANQRVIKIRIIMFSSILLCLLIGGITAVLLAKKNYNPVKELLKLLSDNNNSLIKNKHDNEYQIIQDCMSSYFLERERLNKKIGEQNLAFKTSYIEKLLKGRIEHKENTLDILASMGINLYSEYFAVMLINIDDFGDVFSVIGEEDFKKTLDTINFVFKNVIEELAARNQQGIMIEVDDRLACLVNYKPDRIQNAKEDLKNIAEEAQKFINEKFHITFTVSISDVHHMISGIQEAWEEANEAMNYRLVEGNCKLIQYEDKKVSSNKYFYPLEMEYKLVNCIKAGESSAAIDIINIIFEENLTQNMSLKMAKCLMYDLISTVIKVEEELSSIYKKSLLEETGIIGKLMECKTLPDIKIFMTDIIKQVCEKIQNGKKTANYRMSDSIADYIVKNFADVNLGLAKIAEHFEITPTYVSRIYKEQTGEGIQDFINKIRLEKAKEMLKEGEDNISTVAEKVGYSESRSLIRLFKKYEGVTPGKYKVI